MRPGLAELFSQSTLRWRPVHTYIFGHLLRMEGQGCDKSESSTLHPLTRFPSPHFSFLPSVETHVPTKVVQTQIKCPVVSAILGTLGKFHACLCMQLSCWAGPQRWYLGEGCMGTLPGSFSQGPASLAICSMDIIVKSVKTKQWALRGIAECAMTFDTAQLKSI